MYKCRQHFESQSIRDVREHCSHQLSNTETRFQEGARIAVAVGSRGIANLKIIVKEVIKWVESRGGCPFIIPAMGSHGGASAEGQKKVLHSYDICEETMGCPIHSSMETVELDKPDQDFPARLFMDKSAFEADGIIIINRIKPHTDFHGKYESGLMKMSVIGLGKESQASEMHSFGVHGLKTLTPLAAKYIIETGKILLGVAVVENAYDETVIIKAIPGPEIPEQEPELLKKAATFLPSLPNDTLHVLFVDRLGKNISGTGMDTNIIGRILIKDEPDPDLPNIHTIAVSDLTTESGGNATGMGLADLITEKFRGNIDEQVTRKNLITSGFLQRAKMPMVAKHDSEAMDIALRASGCRDLSSAQVVRIGDTLHLDTLWMSKAAINSIRDGSKIDVIEEVSGCFKNDGYFKPL